MPAYLTEDVEIVLGQVALETAHKFRGLVEIEDVTQELWLWVARKQEAVERNLGKDSFQPWLRTSLRNAARDYIASIRNSTDSLLDQEYYNLAQIEVVLPCVWDDDYLLGSGGQVESRVSGGGDPSTGGNWLVACLDVKKAYSRLSNYYQEMLRLRYHEGWYQQDIADHFDKGESTIQYHLTKALKTIQRELGGPQPFEGGRKAMTNAQSLAITRNTYDGDN